MKTANVEIKKREGESASSFMYRFTKKMQQSGILREAKKRKFKKRDVNRNKRKAAALYREGKRKEFVKAKKLGRA